MNEIDIVKEHSLAYIVYAIGLHLIDSDKDFDRDAIDDEWNTRVLPWAKEFYYSKEYNDETRPLMDCLNEFIAKKIEESKLKNFNVHVGMRYTCDVIVQAKTEEEAKAIASSHIEDIDIEDCDFASDDYDAWIETEPVRGDIITKDGWKAI